MSSGGLCLATIPPAQTPSPLPCQMPPGSPAASPGALRSQNLPSQSRPVPPHDTLIHLNCVLIPPLNPPAILNAPTPPPFLPHPADVLPLLFFSPPTFRILLRSPDPLCVSSLLRRAFSLLFFLLHTHFVRWTFYRPLDVLPLSAGRSTFLRLTPSQPSELTVAR